MGSGTETPVAGTVESCEAWDHLRYLSNSFQRVRLLDRLSDSPTDLRGLKDDLDAPRTTLQRNLTQLERRGWIERTSSGYATTPVGQLLVTEIGRMIEATRTIETLSPFLEAVDDPQTLDVNRLADPVVTVPEPNRPHAPMKRLFEMVRTGTDGRGMFPVISGELLRHYRRSDGCSPATSEIVLPTETIDSLREGTLPEGVDLLEGDEIHLLKYDDELPYGLVIAGDGVALLAYDEVGRIQALVESNGHETIEWAEQVYDWYRNQAKPVGVAADRRSDRQTDE